MSGEIEFSWEWICLVVPALMLIWFLWEKAHRRTYPVKPGLNDDITLPHEERFELYTNSLSLCSRKARICFAELGIPYKHHHIDLIETGSYENISRHFLRVNPASLVPVLVYNGHPVYESDEIIRFAAGHADTATAPLISEDAEIQKIVDYWIYKASLTGDDPMKNMAMTAGSCIPPLTIPVFIAAMQHIPVNRVFEGLLFHRLKIRPIGFLFMKIMGLRGLPHSRLRKMVSTGRDLMMKHLQELEEHLKKTEGAWIAGEQFTLADVSWMSHFERMEESCWLEEYVKDERLPNIAEYWQRLKERPSYRTAIVDFAHPIIEQAKADLIAAKEENSRLRDIYQV